MKKSSKPFQDRPGILALRKAAEMEQEGFAGGKAETTQHGAGIVDSRLFRVSRLIRISPIRCSYRGDGNLSGLRGIGGQAALKYPIEGAHGIGADGDPVTRDPIPAHEESPACVGYGDDVIHPAGIEGHQEPFVEHLDGPVELGYDQLFRPMDRGHLLGPDSPDGGEDREGCVMEDIEPPFAEDPGCGQGIPRDDEFLHPLVDGVAAFRVVDEDEFEARMRFVHV